MRRKTLILSGIALLAAAGGAMLYFNDPQSASFMPKCIFHSLTGFDCPSCGSTRALYAIMHGRLAEGVGYNPFILVSWPLLLFIFTVYAFFPKQRMSRWLWWVIITYIVLFVVWWVLRNLLGV